MTKSQLVRAAVVPVATLSLLFLAGCIIRPTHPVQRPQQPVIVTQPAPVVVQRPVVVHQPAPVIVQRPTIVLQRPVVSPVLTPVRVSVPAPVAAASVSNGAINFPRQRIRYPLRVTYGRVVNIYVDGHGLDPTVAVYDAYGNRVGFNDDGGSGLDSQLNLSLASGNYIIEVAGWSSSTGSYSLSIR